MPNGFNFLVNYFHRRNLGGARKGKYPHRSIFLPKDIFLTPELKRGTQKLKVHVYLGGGKTEKIKK